MLISSLINLFAHSIHSSIFLSCHRFILPSIYISIHQSTQLHFYSSIHLSIQLHFYPSIHLSIHLIYPVTHPLYPIIAGSIKVLLRMGAEINERDYKRRTPLFVAAETGWCIPPYLYPPLPISCLFLSISPSLTNHTYIYSPSLIFCQPYLTPSLTPSLSHIYSLSNFLI